VAWSNNDFLVVMQYFEKKTSRALVFAASSSVEPVLLYAAGLIQRWWMLSCGRRCARTIMCLWKARDSKRKLPISAFGVMESRIPTGLVGVVGIRPAKVVCGVRK